MESSVPISDSWIKSVVWYQTAEGLWKLAEVNDRKKESNNSWVFTLLDKDNQVLKRIKTYALDKFDFEFEAVKRHDRNASVATQTVDMTTLVCLNEPEMIECLRCRYEDDKIYTRVGPILIAVNPFRTLPIYRQEKICQYCDEGFASVVGGTNSLPPHIFQIGNSAYHGMFIDSLDINKRENQVIIVHGESGSGKTASVKFIMDFLAVVSSKRAEQAKITSYAKQSGDQVVASNPIIESFGNAKTLRNNNSSRFGKFIEVCYDKPGLITGAVIRSYLLETLRVTRQAGGERNFHIFYEVCSEGNPFRERLVDSLPLHSRNVGNILELFRYTNQSGEYHRHDNETDENNFTQLRKAMSICLIDADTQVMIFHVILALLHIGNIGIVGVDKIGGEHVDFSSDTAPHVVEACKLLGITPAVLLHAISRRKLIVAGVEIEKRLNRDLSVSAVDALAQHIFHSLFQWIISKINSTLTIPNSSAVASFVGILDIFGFEYFAHNSFEQLCINYTNEKLQSHFNFAIFQTEKEIYESEGLVWTVSDFPDNSVRLELLEHRQIGIFALCDEQLKIPHATDERFAKALYEKCASHAYFEADKVQQKSLLFTVKHFARDVTYSARGFIDKNRANIAPEFIACLQASDIDLVKEMAAFDPWKADVENIVDVSHDNNGGGPVKSSSCKWSPIKPEGDGLLLTKSASPLGNFTTPVVSSHPLSPSTPIDTSIEKTDDASPKPRRSLFPFVSERVKKSTPLTIKAPTPAPPPAVAVDVTPRRGNLTHFNSVQSLSPPTQVHSHTSFPPSSGAIGGGRLVHVRKTASSISGIFSQQLNELMQKMNRTQAHFVRCIKPNVDLTPAKFEPIPVMHQLRCGGTLAAIQVFRSGYSTRIKINAFVQRFSCFSFVCGRDSSVVQEWNSLLALARAHPSAAYWDLAMNQFFAVMRMITPIINAVESVKLPSHFDYQGGVMVGRTRVFLRPYCNEYIESVRFYTGCVAARTLQHFARNYFRRRRGRLPLLRHCVTESNKTFLLAAHGHVVRRLRACVRLQHRIRVFIQQCRLHRARCSASRLSAFRRGCLVLRAFRRTRRAAVLVQAMQRRRLMQAAYRHTLSLVCFMQVRLRAWLALVRRRRLERLQLMNARLPRLQACVRGYRTRRLFRSVIIHRVCLTVARLDAKRTNPPELLRFVTNHKYVMRLKEEGKIFSLCEVGSEGSRSTVEEGADDESCSSTVLGREHASLRELFRTLEMERERSRTPQEKETVGGAVGAGRVRAPSRNMENMNMKSEKEKDESLMTEVDLGASSPRQNGSTRARKKSTRMQRLRSILARMFCNCITLKKNTVNDYDSFDSVKHW